MFNDFLLFDKNFDTNISCNKKIKINNECICYNSKVKRIDLKQVNKLINVLASIFSNDLYTKLPIEINLGDISFEDKLSFMLLECAFYYYIQKYDCFFRLISDFKTNIITEGVIYSPLNYVKSFYHKNKGLYHNNNAIYIKKFEWDVFYKHFRRLIRTEDNHDNMQTSKVMQDVDSYLKFFSIKKEYRDDISEVVAELIDNALEHSNSDCLLDLDITTDYVKKSGVPEELKDKYCGINIVVINFSNCLIGEQLKNKIINGCDLPQRYNVINKAYKKHSQYWNENYSENDFFLLSSFQHKISGRSDTSSTGGTGLTKLLKSIEKKSDAYNCYLLTGNRIFNFDHNLINFDSDSWVGFNRSNNYLELPPDDSCFSSSQLFFPGTAYNLNFVLKKEGN